MPLFDKENIKRLLTPHVRGCIGLVGGILASILGVWLPIHQAATHSHTVNLSLKMALIAPLLIVVGSIYAIAPKWAVRVFGTPQDKKKIIWLLHIPLLILGWFLYTTVKAKISTYGYRV